MAKKKATDINPEAEFDQATAVAAVIADLNKEYKAEVAVAGRAHADRRRLVIPISPSFDLNVGGVVEGSWNIFEGPEKSYKTGLALNICREAQKPENGSRPIFYVDVECRVERRDLEGVHGLRLDPPYFHLIRGTTGAPLTSTDHYSMGERILKDVPGAVLVFDSLSAMTAPGTMEKGINEAGDRSSGYKLAAQFCSLMKSVVPANRSIFIGIAHQYANTSGMGPAKRGKMPNSFKYQATTHLEFKWAKRWRTGGAEEDSKGPQIGIIPHIFVKHSSLTASGGEFPMYARFGVGIDKVYELIQLGVELGLVRQLGSWFSLPWAEGEPKAQGTEKLYQLLDANPALATNLADKIREATS